MEDLKEVYTQEQIVGSLLWEKVASRCSLRHSLGSTSRRPGNNSKQLVLINLEKIQLTFACYN